MDNIKECTIPECGKLPDLSQKKVLAGRKQLRKALEKGFKGCVYLAKDADPAITEPVLRQCMEHGIRVSWCSSMSDLGKACGIDVGASAAAVPEE